MPVFAGPVFPEWYDVALLLLVLAAPYVALAAALIALWRLLRRVKNR